MKIHQLYNFPDISNRENPVIVYTGQTLREKFNNLNFILSKFDLNANIILRLKEEDDISLDFVTEVTMPDDAAKLTELKMTVLQMDADIIIQKAKTDEDWDFIYKSHLEGHTNIIEFEIEQLDWVRKSLAQLSARRFRGRIAFLEMLRTEKHKNIR